MSDAAASAAPPGPARAPIDWATAAVVGGLAALALVVNLATGGNIIAVLGVLGGIGVLALVWFIPLRWSVTALLFLGMTMESPYDAFAEYQWSSPVEPIGRLLLGHLNATIPIKALVFSGFDCVIAYLLIVQLSRRARGKTIDTVGSTPMAPPLVAAVGISLASMFFLFAFGIARGGDVQKGLLQIQQLGYAGVLFFILHGAYRGSVDLAALGRTLVIAAVYRASLAVWIYRNVRYHGELLACSTTHSDSSLFAAALALLIIMINERAKHSTHWTRLMAAGIILLGMINNHRRLVWVSLIGSLAIVALVSPWTPLKRRIVRLAALGFPLLVLYVAAGWNNPYSTIFKPVATMRSVMDGKSDGSTLWRDIENGSLVKNISDHPFVGLGFGHEYTEYWHLPSVAEAYPQYRFVPHNSMVALFVFAGPAGVAGIFAMLIATVFLAARSYHRSADPAVRSAALLCIVVVYLFLNITYGDIGLSYWITTFTLAPAMTMAGKLAIETGAWPRPLRRSVERATALARRRRATPPREDPEGWAAP